MSRVFHRTARMHPPVAVRGDGCYVIDANGKRYLDASGGAAVSCLGHSHPGVVRAIKGQLDRLPYAHSGFFTTEVMEDLADHLIDSAPRPACADAGRALDRVYFVSGGSEAVEAALKLARQYFLEIGQPDRRYFAARRQSYHGNTIGALSVGGNMWRRTPFEPILIPANHVAPCYAYREKALDESLEDYGRRAADTLEAAVQELGPGNVAAFLAEPVVGATAGAVPAVPGYFTRVREICDRHGILLILDEVMCGMGRTGTLYAHEEDGIVPDMVTIAKGLGAGYQPIGATLVGKHIFEAIDAGSGFFQHGHTYMGHPAACAAGLAAQRAIQDDNLLGAVNERGASLRGALEARFGNHPYIGDIRGRGLFLGLEIVSDRGGKEPFDPSLKLHARVKKEALERGLMCYPMGGTIDGRRGDHILLAPPFILTEAQVGEIVDKLAEAMQAALASAGLSV